MLIRFDPDEWKTEIESNTCDYHKRNPGSSWPGCTCSASYRQVRREPGEVQDIKARKRLEREESVLSEAAAIKARRGMKP